jgi:hypothetical protein
MSIGWRLEDDELSDLSTYELYSVLGERDTPRMFEQPYAVSFEFDIPFGGGNSIDRKTIYVDRDLYQAAMGNEFAATGLSPEQIIERWLDHEHTEICIAQGDNAVDTYFPSHLRALRREHEGVLAILGVKDSEKKLNNYEKVIWPALLRAYHKPIKKPPLDLWCGPLLDDPTEYDEELLKQLAGLKVVDAGKRSKYDVHYGFGEKECVNCSMFRPDILALPEGLADCDVTSGLVRVNRHCDFWKKREDNHPIAMGARQAEDGEWYLPDRNRPGKYLRINHG